MQEDSSEKTLKLHTQRSTCSQASIGKNLIIGGSREQYID